MYRTVRQLKGILKTSLDVIICTNTKGEFTLVSDSSLNLFGYRPEEMMGRNVSDFIHPEDLNKTTGFRQQLMEGHEAFYFENRYIRKDGAIAYVEWSARWSMEEEAIYAIARDASPKKKYEESIRKSEAQYKMLFLLNPLPMWIFDRETYSFLQVNEAAIRHYGYSRDEFYSMTILDLRPKEDRERVKNIQRNIINEVEVYHGYWKHLKKNGDLIDVEITSHQVAYQDKIATLVLVYDITEKLKAQRELQQRAAELVASNRELEQFAYIASHDLQEPLRMVSSFLQLLEKKNKEKLDATSIQYINFAVDGAERMKGLIKDLLDFSKIGTKNEKKETIDLEKVVQQVLEFFQYEITTSNIHVIVTPRLPVVYAHGTQMQQLFQNLISNAIKYRHSQRSLLITIEVTELSDEYKFSISDNGIGIDPEFFEKIFVVFKRLHRKDEYSGSGIGLAICKKIVELHGGKIWVESKPDIGTTFYFTLPAVHA